MSKSIGYPRWMVNSFKHTMLAIFIVCIYDFCSLGNQNQNQCTTYLSNYIVLVLVLAYTHICENNNKLTNTLNDAFYLLIYLV